MECRCGTKMIMIEMEGARIFVCPEHSAKEAHDIVIINIDKKGIGAPK